MEGFHFLHPKLQAVIEKYGYKSPTRVQVRAYNVISRGYHTLIISPTGSGKTEAAFFPILDAMLRKGVSPEGIQALYITPLRALNRDIFRRMKRITEELGFTIAVRHGDTPQHVRRSITRKPPNILVTTPETLQVILVGSKIREALREVRWVIVDEVHELLESKRGAQLSIGLERLGKLAGRRIQRIGLSATMGDPLIAASFLGGYRRVEIVEENCTERYEISLVHIEGNIEERLSRIEEILDEYQGSILLFVNTRDTAEFLGSKLSPSSQVRVHHGSLDRDERVTLEREFKEGKIKTLICTSSLELGIDVGSVDLVIQYMSPRQAVRLAQRAGRAGHGPQRISRSIVITVDVQDLLEAAVIARRVKRGNLEKPRVYELALDVLAHQLVGMALESRGISLQEAWQTITRVAPFSGLSFTELIRTARLMDELKYIKLTSDLRIYPRKKSIKYYFEGVSTIPQSVSFRVVDLSSQRRIGTLDEAFVAANLERGDYFVLAGRIWRVESIDLENREINVLPAVGEAVIPAWIGEEIPVSYKVAREVGALKRRLAEALQDEREFVSILEEYGLEQYKERVKELVKSQLDSCGVIPSDRDVVIEELGSVTIVHAHLGSRGNYALGLALAYLLSRFLGVNVRFRSCPYGVIIYSNLRIASGRILSVLNSQLLKALEEALRRSSLYKYKFVHVARRFGVFTDKPPKGVSKLAETLQGTIIGEEALREAEFSRVEREVLRRFLTDVEEGKIKITVLKQKEASPFGEMILKHAVKGGYSISGLPASMLVKVVRNRLLETRLKLVCLYCAEWQREIAVKEANEKIRCPICGSNLIAVTSRWDTELVKILRKKKRGAKLTPEEQRLFKRALKTAKLLSYHGKKALVVLAGKGVGAETASRILNTYMKEEDIVKAVIKAEEAYARTKKFWSEESRRA